MEFVCRDPKATVRAANVRATLDAFRLMPDVGRRLVEKHALSVTDLKPDKFILVQRWLDILAAIQRDVGANKLRSVGWGIIESADFPPHLDDPEDVLLELDAIYRMNHRGDVGRYVVARRPDGTIEVRCETPYPRMFERGLVEGVTKSSKFRRSGTFSVDYVEAEVPGDLTCTMYVRRLT